MSPVFSRSRMLAAWPLLAALALACSSGGSMLPPETATCSATQKCPEGLVCVMSRGLCALPSPDGEDMAMPKTMDMAMSGSTDMAMSGSTDMAMSGSTDMAMSTGDMATRPPDMTTPPADMTTPPPSGPRACPADHWCWENPLPQPRNLRGLWGASASDVWAVGDLGVALHWNGTSWLQVQTGITETLTAVWGRASNQVWIVGTSGTILFWDGSRFTPQTASFSGTFYALWGDSATVWAVGSNGTIRKWDGTAWTAAATGVSNSLTSIWGSASNDVWAVGTSGIVCHYGGTSWTCGVEFGSGSSYTVVGTSKTDIWALGNMAEAWHWNGSTWTSTTRGSPSNTIMGAFALGPKNIWAVGLSSTSLHYDGTSWAASTIGPIGTALNAVWAADANTIFAVGGGGTILRYDGTSFKTVSSGFVNRVVAMWGTSERDVWAFTDDKNARHFDGTSWTSTPLGANIYSVTGTGPTDIWAGSDGGRVFRYDGTSWTPISTRDAAATITGIYIAAPDRVVLAGTSSIQFWDGARYITSLTPSYEPHAVWGTGPNNIWVGASGACTVYRYDGASWSSSQISACSGTIIGIHGTSASDVYFVSESSAQIFRWDGTRYNTLSIGSAYGKTGIYATTTRMFVTTTYGELLVNSAGSWSNTHVVYNDLRAIAGFGPDKAWVGGAGGFILSYKP